MGHVGYVDERKNEEWPRAFRRLAQKPGRLLERGSVPLILSEALSLMGRGEARNLLLFD
jgi:hypothetical protein